MAARNKRIADFIESIPESKIESSTILFGGESENPLTPLSTNNGSCTNTQFESCDKSTNRGSCKNKEFACAHSNNGGDCDNSYVKPTNNTTDSCPA